MTTAPAMTTNKIASIASAFSKPLANRSRSYFLSLTNNNCSPNVPTLKTVINNGSSAPNTKLHTIYDNNLSDIQFSRSSVGGSKYLVNAHTNVTPEGCDLIFESRFESGNLAKAIKITPVYYELYLRPDLYTNKHTQWFYFRVTNTRKEVPYRLVRVCVYNFTGRDV